MTGESSSTHDLETENQNPFPATAVSTLSRIDHDYVSIQTDATNEAAEITKAYLAAAPRETGGNAGQVVAIVGEYGTGKTHIALQILTNIRSDQSARTEAFYLDAPADTFLALYKERFFPQLAKTKVIERVREYFSDIIAADLERSELTQGAAQALRDRKASPLETIEKFGLMDSQYRGVLTNQLEKVTEHPDFATAFALLLRPDFEHAVWEWLAGQAPDQSLVDRGISRTLDSDWSVLEVIGVFAFLFGRQNWRFVLIIDEMEKVLSPSSRSMNEDTILAFKKMMEAIGKTNSMLILVGLPDFLDALPEDALQRLSSTIRPSNLSPENVENYISESKKQCGQLRGLKPFNRDVIKYVSEIAGGNARKVVRLCFHVYRHATEAGSVATRAMVRATARDQFEVTTAEDVFKEISRVVDANGWLHETEKTVGKGKKKQFISFWLPIGESGDGCAIVVENSILDKSASKEIIARVKALAEASAESEILTLLIVNGHVAENLRKSLEETFDRVLVNSLRSFPEDLDAILKGLVRRIEEKTNKETISKVLARVDQISRQLNSVRNDFAERLDYISRAPQTEVAVEKAILGVFRSIGERAQTLPLSNPEADALFDKVQYMIRRISRAFEEYARHSKRRIPISEILSSLENASRLVSDFKSEIYEIEREVSTHTEKYSSTRNLGDICQRFEIKFRTLDDTEFPWQYLREHARELDAPTRILHQTDELPELLRDIARNVYDTY